MFDLQVLAFRCDLTRVITLMVGHEHSGMTFPQIGVPDAHHPISHHQQEPEKVAKVAKINAYHVQMFARSARQAAGHARRRRHAARPCDVDVRRGDGRQQQPLADRHPDDPGGRRRGHLKGGRHIRFKNMPLANLHLTLLDQFGVHWDRIGDSTGRVDANIFSSL